MLKFVTVILIVLPLLNACTTAPIEVVSPDVVEYPRTKQIEVAKEVERGSCPTSTEFLLDYMIMRDQARVR